MCSSDKLWMSQICVLSQVYIYNYVQWSKIQSWSLKSFRRALRRWLVRASKVTQTLTICNRRLSLGYFHRAQVPGPFRLVWVVPWCSHRGQWMLWVARGDGWRSARGLCTSVDCMVLRLSADVPCVDRELWCWWARRRSKVVTQFPRLESNGVFQRNEPPLYLWVGPICFPYMLGWLPLIWWWARLNAGA